MATSEEKPIQTDGGNGAAVKRKKTMDEIAVDLALPEPPSKRARRALKKGKTLPPKTNGGGGIDDKDKDGDEEEDREKKDRKEKARSEHGIWVGNLPFTVTVAELKQWLGDNSGGVITEEAMTRIKMPTSKDAGRDRTQKKPANKGFAYVDFADIGPKVAAIALSETELGHRKLLIKDSKSFQGRPAKEKEPEAVEAGPDGKPLQSKGETDPNASRKIFVGNMSFQTTEEDVRRNFEKCGEIEWVKVATFEDTGKCKGYGWVKFREPGAAAWAVKGFVKVKEAVETEEDFEDGEEDDGGNDEKKDEQKQFKTRKWWVNRMLGRELKLELAEDDQARYKKRFGKDAPRRQQGDGNDDGTNSNGDKFSRGRNPRWRHEATDDGQPGEKANVPAETASKPLKEASDIQVARLTGAVVKHTGTKVTFD